MRGVIMSVEGNKAVLLTQGGDFKQIRNKNYNVGDKVKVTTNYAVRIGSIAAALAVFAIGGVTSYFMPASYVSVDINPSFLMTLNVYDKVISIEPLNDEAKTVLKHTDVKGMDINETVEAIINESRQEGYINDAGGEVIVSVVPGIRTPRIEDKNTKDNINLIVNTSDKTELDEARDMGVSIAKAKAIEDYTGEFGGTVSDNAGKLSGKTVKQIENEIAEKKAVSPTKPAQTASPQPNIDVTLQSVPQPALPAESKSVQRQSAKAAPNPTAASAQIFMPQQIFTLSPAKGNDENNSYNEKKAEGVKPEIKQETPKAEAETEKPQNSSPSAIPTQPKKNEQEREPEQPDNNKNGSSQPSGTQAELKPQNSEPSEPKENESGQSNSNTPTTQKEPEQNDSDPNGSAPKEPDQKENIPSDRGNAAPSHEGSAPSQLNTQGGSTPSNNGGTPPSSGNSRGSSNGASNGSSGGGAPSSGGGGGPR